MIADPACDMWSLGVIAFHILSGAVRLLLLPSPCGPDLEIESRLGCIQAFNAKLYGLNLGCARAATYQVNTRYIAAAS